MEQLTRAKDIQKKIDTYLDKTLARYLINKFQKLSPDVWAIIYPEQALLCFFYKKIIFYKVHMNALTDTLSAEHHLKEGSTYLRTLKLGLVPPQEMQQISLSAGKIDLSLGKKL